MMDQMQLPNAPIKEAVIDIQITSELLKVEQLEGLLKKLPSGYTESKPITETYVEFGVGAKGKNILEKNDTDIIGYRIENDDSNFIVQLKKTGFTLSKLPPYDSWATFKNEAQELWSIYSDIVPDFKFSRLAVRYINEVPLPLLSNKGQSIEFDDYLINGPQLPNNMGTVVNSFFSRIVIPWPDLKTTIIVIQALKEINADDSKAIVILDFDISRVNVADFSETEMWEFFDKLRDLKNKAFVGSLTSKAMELFK